LRIAKESGRKIMELWKNNIKPSDILTRQAFLNAIAVDMLIGCSTNTALHLPAMARELDIDIQLDDFERASKGIPNICHLSPAGRHYMQDVHEAGGMSAIIKIAIDHGIADGSCKSVTGMTIGEVVKDVKVLNHNVIRPYDDPYLKDGGLAIVRGNLAPDGAIIKSAAVDPKLFHFTGPARVFDSENTATMAVKDGKIKAGDIIVIRYEGPKGGPGMQEMVLITAFLKGMGLADKIGLVTDGRFSGASSGAAVGHVTPEAAEGGLIGLVEEGDAIEINITDRYVTLHVDEKTIEERRARWKPVEKDIPKGYLGRYAKQVGPVSQGAFLEVK